MSSRFFVVGIFALTLASAVRADLTSPVLNTTIPAQSLGRAGSAQQLNLASFITDPNVPGTAVRITINAGTLVNGNIDVALTDSQTPLTVANFLAYINAGSYANNIIHRSIPGFIFQGGEYIFPTPTSLAFITALPAVQNEPGISNVRGTIAMAKVSGNVNSATDQWFINLVDNSANLDNQNGGFTVFGRVIGNGMTVADAVAAISTFDGTSVAADWTNIPLASTTIGDSNGFIKSAFVVTTATVVPAITYAASSANTSLVTVGISGNTLTMTPSSANIGSTNITITSTDLEGGVLQSNFTVSVLDTYANWKAGFSFGNATLALEASDPDGDGLLNLAEYAFGGDPLHPTPVTGAPKVESGGGVVFYIKQQSALSYEVDRSVDMIHWTKVWQSSDGFANAAVFSRTTNIVSGFDQLTIRDSSPPGGNVHFLRVQVTRSL